MIQITYTSMVITISIIWILVRVILCVKYKRLNWKRELQLLLVYICIIVVARCTFFPFAKVDGKVQPLILDIANIFPFRINLIPFVNLLDYPEFSSAMLNVIGNTTMFIPIGVIWPIVYKELNTHKKVITAGACFSLCIEVLQLPFYDRVTDIDDLILNSLGFLIGYLLYVLVKKFIRKRENNGKRI
ncbi:MAG: VanZ family protein [Roseburia sp.]|nr:VanZ family protein [Roseburia sp.]